MREHMGLYRGKRLDNGAWVYGSLLVFPNTKRTKILRWNQSDLEFDEYEVVPASIGECTAMRDKNGKLIFEGDIVESEFTKMPYLVCFGEYTYTNDYGEEECACGWYNKDSDDIVTGFGCPETWATVIGNVVDNPELLEGGCI